MFKPANIIKLKCLFLFLAFSFVPTIMPAQIERVIVETYYISDNLDSTDTDGGKLAAGSVTYRIFVDLKPGNKLVKIYGDANHALKFSSTKPFFNNTDGETYGVDMKRGLYGFNTVALDTWLTLGQTTIKAGGKANFGILKRQDTNGSFVGGNNNDGGSASVPAGLLTNTAPAAGIALTKADGMFEMSLLSSTISSFGIKNFSFGTDSTMFGSLVSCSEFSSNNVFLRNAGGVSGVIPDSNQILVAQLTTKGQITFEMNFEVEQLVDGVPTIVKYVADDKILLDGEKKSRWLKYPFPPPECGCRNPDYLEFDPNLECDAKDSCKHRIVFGCMDSMACNFDPKVNFHIKVLCCYPGSCGGRDISVVCPSVNGGSFDCDIYPNPATNSIFLDVVSGVSDEISYYIVDSFGSLVLSDDLGTQQRIIRHEIDLTGLNDGLYLMRVNIGNSFYSKQFFKNSE